MLRFLLVSNSLNLRRSKWKGYIPKKPVKKIGTNQCTSGYAPDQPNLFVSYNTHYSFLTVGVTYPNMAIGIQIAAIGAGFNLSSGLGNRPSFASKIGAR
jgi:hypothetical protein